MLLFIGQPADTGSESDIGAVRQAAEREDVSIFALTLPLLGKNFVADTFSLRGVAFEERGGFRAGADLGRLVSVLNRSANAASASDPFAVLTAATGGTRLNFRTLSYYPGSAEPGYHAVKIEVSIPGAKVYARPRYWLGSD